MGKCIKMECYYCKAVRNFYVNVNNYKCTYCGRTFPHPPIDEKLPTEIGRLWREADVNYGGGKRNRQRILYSNDGLLFATYDHYHTFYEIINQGGL